jgi:sugar lactone lactonase YvrE
VSLRLIDVSLHACHLKIEASSFRVLVLSCALLSSCVSERLICSADRPCDGGVPTGFGGGASSSDSGFEVDAGPPRLEVLAGTLGSFGNLDGRGAEARFNGPLGVAVDPAGNVFVADTNNHVIRKVSPDGLVLTLAGKPGEAGSANGKGSTARFKLPHAVALDEAGNLYVADTDNYTVRKIDALGFVSTLAGLAGSFGSEDGVGSAARFGPLSGLAVDSQGVIYASDGSRIRRIASDGTVTTLAGNPNTPFKAIDGTGAAASFYQTRSIAYSKALDLLFVADDGAKTLRQVTLAGQVTTIAGNSAATGPVDGDAAQAGFGEMSSVAVNALGTVAIADTRSHAIRLFAGGQVKTFAGTLSILGSKDGVGSAAQFNSPSAVAYDSKGHLYVVERSNHTLRKVSPQGEVTTVAGLAPTPGSVDGSASTARFIRPTALALSPDNVLHVFDPNLRAIASDGTTTTVAFPPLPDAGVQSFVSPNGLSFAPNGDAYWVEGQSFCSSFSIIGRTTRANVIRRRTAAGELQTVAGIFGSFGSADGAAAQATFECPSGLVRAADGVLYVSDTQNSTIRKVGLDGTVSTLAGQAKKPGSLDGAGASAQFSLPSGMALSKAGFLYVSDTGNHTIRKVTAEGMVSTFVGAPAIAGSDDGTGPLARFNSPGALAVDAQDNLFVADVGNHVVRKVTPDGKVTTVLGRAGSAGTTVGAMPATLFNPLGLVVLSNGELAVSTANGVVVTKEVKP